MKLVRNLEAEKQIRATVRASLPGTAKPLDIVNACLAIAAEHAVTAGIVTPRVCSFLGAHMRDAKERR